MVYNGIAYEVKRLAQRNLLEGKSLANRRVQELDLKIDVLVNNAGFNEFGSFIKTNREKEHDMMYLHMFCDKYDEIVPAINVG